MSQDLIEELLEELDLPDVVEFQDWFSQPDVSQIWSKLSENIQGEITEGDEWTEAESTVDEQLIMSLIGMWQKYKNENERDNLGHTTLNSTVLGQFILGLIQSHVASANEPLISQQTRTEQGSDNQLLLDQDRTLKQFLRMLIQNQDNGNGNSGNRFFNELSLNQNSQQVDTSPLAISQIVKRLVESMIEERNKENQVSERKVESTMLSLPKELRFNPLLSEIGSYTIRTDQATIHVGEQMPREIQQQQFMRQFQNLLRHATMTHSKEGVQSLSVKLHPEHLGRLDVQLTQINGVLSAKIMVSQSAAKELIESQLSQLRQAFVQQQLPVERIEITHQQSQLEKEKDKEGSSSQQQRQDANEDGQEENREFHEEFQDSLYSINEQV
ncbi:flagellar hook-length control protein FliK [Halalkalibacter hemicellulosilyticusJCM 9152]|uniref:Flagellar hook-length control protein FliK n=2 Tax=Halalkalibacter TaxID=2893056 RepID=W4QCZ2_9BACI|nr:flagellar hook-length control protein FliK [Halalkalibacter hemicellulosilyticusJCM 9152]